jgi:hypothetical protein
MMNCFVLLYLVFIKTTTNLIRIVWCFLDDVAAERAIERAAKDVRDQIDKGAADCKFDHFVILEITLFFVSAPPDRAGEVWQKWFQKSVDLRFFSEVTYDIKVRSSDNIVYGENGKGSIRLTIFGDNGSSGPIELRTDEGDTNKVGGPTMTLKRKALDAGKVYSSSIVLSFCNCLFRIFTDHQNFFDMQQCRIVVTRFNWNSR